MSDEKHDLNACWLDESSKKIEPFRITDDLEFLYWNIVIVIIGFVRIIKDIILILMMMITIK